MTPAVVCGTYKWQTPDSIPESRTRLSISAVTFLNSVRRVVRTVILCTECAPELSRLVVICLGELADNCGDLVEPRMQERPLSSVLRKIYANISLLVPPRN